MHNPTGLHERLNAARLQREHEHAVETSERKDPAENHAASLRRQQCDQDITILRHEIAEVVCVRNSITELLRTLSRHTQTSRHLSLCTTHLEDALLRLETHLGKSPNA